VFVCVYICVCVWVSPPPNNCTEQSKRGIQFSRHSRATRNWSLTAIDRQPAGCIGTGAVFEPWRCCQMSWRVFSVFSSSILIQMFRHGRTQASSFNSFMHSAFIFTSQFIGNNTNCALTQPVCVEWLGYRLVQLTPVPLLSIKHAIYIYIVCVCLYRYTHTHTHTHTHIYISTFDQFSFVCCLTFYVFPARIRGLSRHCSGW
jgi:hypothetical protein